MKNLFGHIDYDMLSGLRSSSDCSFSIYSIRPSFYWDE